MSTRNAATRSSSRIEPIPVQRADQHQLDQHNRIDRRPAQLGRVVRRRLDPHELPIATTASNRRSRSSAATSSSKQTDLQRRRLPLRRTHRHRGRLLNRPDRATIWTRP
jgi:hypothetical protein